MIRSRKKCKEDKEIKQQNIEKRMEVFTKGYLWIYDLGEKFANDQMSYRGNERKKVNEDKCVNFQENIYQI